MSSPNVSMIDLTVSTEKATSLAEITAAFRRASKSGLQGVLSVTDEELVSSDYNGDPHSAIVDVSASAIQNTNTASGELSRKSLVPASSAAHSLRRILCCVFGHRVHLLRLGVNIGLVFVYCCK